MASSFTLDVKKFADQFEGGAEQAIRGTAIKLWSAVIKSSPVDEGRFRGNWFASGASPATKTTTNTDKTGDKAISAASQNVHSQKDWSAFTLTNNLPYSEVIEFGGYPDGPNTTGGFSKQAPAGVLRVNVLRFNQLLEAEARKTLPK